MSEEKAYKNRTEMEADTWFGGQLDKVTATIAREKRLALEAETKKFIEAKKGNKHFYPYGEPDCIFCGAFGPTEDDGVCEPIKGIRKQLDDAREELKCKHFQKMEDEPDSFTLCGHLEGSGLMQLLQSQTVAVLAQQDRIEELTNILKERTDELAQLHRANHERRSRLCPHGYEFHAECPDCYLKMTATPSE